jgi:hypothetical protein
MKKYITIREYKVSWWDIMPIWVIVRPEWGEQFSNFLIQNWYIKEEKEEKSKFKIWDKVAFDNIFWIINTIITLSSWDFSYIVWLKRMSSNDFRLATPEEIEKYFI